MGILNNSSIKKKKKFNGHNDKVATEDKILIQ